VECPSLSPAVNSTGQGDEVVASTLTFIGSVTPILFQGATRVFIDYDRSSWNMDPELLAEELEDFRKKGKFPRAVIPTDLYGQCADLDRILELCAPYDIPVVLDSAEALGAKYKLTAPVKWSPNFTRHGGAPHGGIFGRHGHIQKNGSKSKIRNQKCINMQGWGRKKEERELGDERILASGEFVVNVLSGSDNIERPRTLRKIPLSELVKKIASLLKTESDEVLSGNRRRKNCHARDLISFVAAKSMGYKFNDIAEILGIHPVTAGRCTERGKKLIDNDEGIWEIIG